MVKKIKLYKYSVDYFLFLLKRISPNSMVSCNQADIRSWNFFVEYFNTRIDKNFLKQFIEYQMQSWFNDYETDYSRSVRFNWIVGKNAIKRWECNSPEANKFLVKISLKKKYDISKEGKRNLDFLREIKRSEESHKELFFNSLKGFLWCKANTTLFNHKSMNCVICDYNVECKNLLKKELYNVYKIRYYDKESN